MDSAVTGESEQAQLREYVERIIQSEEQDNRRLALDLHDGLVQLMVASFQHLQAAQAWQQRDPSLEQKELNQGLVILRQAITEARRLINELRPAGLDEFGLVQAIKLYIAQVEAETGWEMCLEISPAWRRLPVDLETSLFRIVQESISNARKYAHTDRLSVNLDVTGKVFYVEVSDWGCGFIPAQVETSHSGLHIGLVGIRERARLWGGTSKVVSQPGAGTTIHVEFPIRLMLAEPQGG